MSQTALNLLAISIFTITLSSLLGPLLHLSPFVPAIATFSLLGLATVDTLSWRSQGITLVLDWFASFSPEHRARIVRHEAGHFLVAYLLGIPVTDYTLTAWESFRRGQVGQGGVTFDCQLLDAQLEQGNLSAQWLDRYCTVWMAGAAAETLVYGEAEGGADDREKLSTLWALIRRPLSEKQQKERWSALQARTLIQDHWSAYEALVTALEQRRPVPECCEVIAGHLA